MTDLHKECHCSVKIEHLSVTQGNQKILDDVNLEVKHGEITAIIGRNGAGKTTLLKAIMDRIPHTGTVTYFNSMGKKISQPKLGYVPQSLSFDRGTPLTVADLFCANSGMMPVWFRHKKDKLAHAKEMLAHVGAERLIDKPLGRISGGELQRVLLAFALDPMPDMLILDEPVSALDRRGISSFYDLVTSLRSEYHMPVLLVSHDLGHVTKYCTRAALVDGTIVLTDTAKNILKHKEVREVFGLGEEGIL
jgi:zinc transport system ATP-binding protein